jgi:hypothetical protein
VQDGLTGHESAVEALRTETAECYETRVAAALIANQPLNHEERCMRDSERRSDSPAEVSQAWEGNLSAIGPDRIELHISNTSLPQGVDRVYSLKPWLYF